MTGNLRSKKLLSKFLVTEYFIDCATASISNEILNHDKLSQWVNHYHLDDNIKPVEIGIVMAGIFPWLDFMIYSPFLSAGIINAIKLSSKDDVLISFSVDKL
jgi:hypothetical protein